jgi:hypothetical protein
MKGGVKNYGPRIRNALVIPLRGRKCTEYLFRLLPDFCSFPIPHRPAHHTMSPISPHIVITRTSTVIVCIRLRQHIAASAHPMPLRRAQTAATVSANTRAARVPITAAWRGELCRIDFLPPRLSDSAFWSPMARSMLPPKSLSVAENIRAAATAAGNQMKTVKSGSRLFKTASRRTWRPGTCAPAPIIQRGTDRAAGRAAPTVDPAVRLRFATPRT